MMTVLESLLGRRLGSLSARAVEFSERIIVLAAGLLVLMAIVIAAVTLYELFFQGLRINLRSIETVGGLQDGVQAVFAGVLLLMLGLELLETLKNYFIDSQIRTEVILVVALIAVARHVMVIDIEHTRGSVLAGAAILTLALAVSYRLVRVQRTTAGTGPPQAPPETR